MIQQSKKYYLLNAFLLLLALVSFFAWYHSTLHADSPQIAPNIDSFAIDVSGVQFNDLGEKRGEMQTPKLLHFVNGDSSLLTTPYVTLYSQGNKAPWFISSRTGKTLNGTQKIDLIDDVVIHQPVGAQNQDTIITTSLLHIFPKKQLANTDASVMLVQSGVKITSVGMDAYLDQKRVLLLSQARGLYDPSKAQSIHSLS